jgi:hypothetical protein
MFTMSLTYHRNSIVEHMYNYIRENQAVLDSYEGDEAILRCLFDTIDEREREIAFWKKRFEETDRAYSDELWKDG